MLRKGKKKIEKKNLWSLHHRKTLWVCTCLRGSAAALQKKPKTKKFSRCCCLESITNGKVISMGLLRQRFISEAPVLAGPAPLFVSEF